MSRITNNSWWIYVSIVQWLSLAITPAYIVNEIPNGWSHHWESGDLPRVISEFFDNDTKVEGCSFGPLLVIGRWLLDRHTWSLTMLTRYSVNYETGWMCKYHHWTIGTWIPQELFEIRDIYISFWLQNYIIHIFCRFFGFFWREIAVQLNWFERVVDSLVILNVLSGILDRGHCCWESTLATCVHLCIRVILTWPPGCALSKFK